ncbi:MAG: ATP-dependent Clp protease ATP-binding subunit [Synergistaceae bacterium]|nr:ATP-dependent Clp protease ATP-binding subunit [Candidatus Equadaptatus faecalis]
MALDFTEKSKKIFSTANYIARQHGSSFLNTEHLLAALFEEDGARFAELLGSCEANPEAVRRSVAELLGSGEKTETSADLPASQETKAVFEFAMKEARELNSGYIGTEHILLGLLDEEAEGRPGILAAHGVTAVKMKAVLAASSSAEPSDGDRGTQETVPFSTAKAETPTLDETAADLTAEASAGKLDPVIGRSREIQRVIQILSRKTKNNPVLVGEPGVGKTAVVEGLAALMSQNRVPEIMQGKRLMQLNVASLVAGTKYRGEFEEKITKLMKEVSEAGNIILFIDEIHTIVGAGGTEGAVDAANILKPALARGDIQLIGATTISEYRKYIEKDSALERRFQPVHVDEPSEDDTFEILKGVRESYEKHHRVKISDEALKAAVSLSKRYITDRFLPDKAIDLVDEASASVKIRQLADERKTEALVSFADIAEAVSAWSKVPVSQLTEEESGRLLRMEEELSKTVIGQEEALHAVSSAVRRARTGLRDSKRPLGSFLFLGPTGVGKTQIARSLANFLFGSDEAMIRLDMSEYMERHEAAKLIGPPPGYAGYEEGGKLTEAIRRRPYSVVLFDEVEKAHPDVYNMLLQLLDDGRLTDGQGHLADFRNAIIILTSNLGVPEEVKPAALGFGVSAKIPEKNDHEKLKSAMLAKAAEFFRPEFLNRIDETVVFKALEKDSLFGIMDVLLKRVAEAARSGGIEISVDETAKEFMLEKAYDPKYGARPLRRAVQTMLEDKLAEMLLAKELVKGDKLSVSSNGEKLVFQKTE